MELKKIVLLIFALTLFSTAVVVRFINPVVSYSTKTELPLEVGLPVHNIDSGENFSTIQEAINDNETLDGHTILVDAETYLENVVVNKTVSLIGEDKETTIIDGNARGTVVDVTASDVLISNFTIRNSIYTAWYSGIKVEMDNCTITNNIITNNWFGIYFGYYPGQQPRHSSDNMLCRNNIKNNRVGVYLLACENSTIIENNVTNSYCGVFFFSGYDNQIYHNNFIENFQQVALPEVESTFSKLSYVWDDLFCVSYPSGGNHWSDYDGTDLLSGPYQNETGSDGIGDTAYTIYAYLPDNYPYPTLVIIDSYPLMAPISFFDAGTWDEVTYYVHTISNSTVSDFNFNPDNYLISFNVNGTDDTVGFCRAAIPKELMWCDDLEAWNVTVNGDPPTYLKAMEDADYTYLYLTYNHSIQGVQIKGIYVIPEFPTWTSMLLLLVLLTVATAIYKRRPLKTPIR